MKIRKRNGRLEGLDVNKIKVVISWASEGFDVNPLELESRVSSVFKDGISTRQIQDNLINQASTLTTVMEPDWRYVAGRLLMMNYWKDTVLNRGYGYEAFVQHVHTMVDAGRYENNIVKLYSDEQLAEAGAWMVQRRDLDYDYAGANMLVRRYMVDNELPQEAFLIISLLLASVEQPHMRMHYAKRFYDMLSLRLISLATPFLSNLRRPKGNLSSCFIVASDDSLDSLKRVWSAVGDISKNGGGVGVNLSRVRCRESWVNGQKGASGGVVPWIKILNDIAVAVNQQGKRAGAVTPSIDCWHMDMPDFLEMQTENGDQRKKAYDVFPQVIVLDEFMRRVEANQQWTLMDPYEVRTKYGIELADLWGDEFTEKYCWLEQQELELTKKVSAKEVMKDMMRSQLETGMPYLAFKCIINKCNPNKHAGMIPAVNLCVESFSNVKPDEQAHTCNLVSINQANVTPENLAEVCEMSVRMLDNGIDLTEPPVAESKTHNSLYRTIGVGSMGFADWLAKKGLTYSKGKEEANSLFEDIAYYTFKASADLAVQRGAYPAFEGSEFSKGKILCHDGAWFQENAKEPQRWLDLIEQIKATGIRNSHIQAIAPNTSSSLLQGCTPSVLAPFAKFYMDKNAKGTVPIAPPFIKGNFWVYQENKNIPQKVVVDVVSAIQKWTDTGISMELCFNLNDPNFNAKYMYETLMDAWKKECKAVYYIRSIQKSGDINDKEDCVSCAN